MSNTINMAQAFNALYTAQPLTEEERDLDMMPQPNYIDMSNPSWEDSLVELKATTAFQDPDIMVSPNLANMWYAPTSMAQIIGDDARMPALEQKVDPNRIFSSEIVALRKLAAEQQKIVKLFERKLVECLTERGKTTLDENDIAAMQAVTTARSTIASINKNQVDIKKNIADLRIKQQTREASAASMDEPTPMGGGRGLSPVAVGRSIMDTIFDTPLPTRQPSPVPTESYTQTSPAEASALIDDLVGRTGTDPHLAYENLNPKTYVVLGDNNTPEYATYDDQGRLIPDYPNPSAQIAEVDIEAGLATDETLMTYPIKEN